MDTGNVSPSTASSDILGLIFEHTLRSTHRDEQCRVVIVLASVCHSWRATCIDAPNLWSRIGPFVHSYDLIRLYLDRSRNHPLSIDYYETGEDERVLPLLGQESERWLDVRLSIPPSFYHLLSSIRGRLPLLRTLFWRYNEDRWDDMASGTNDLDTIRDQEDFGGFGIAPALYQFSFDWPCLKESFPLPWGQLTRLNCSKIHSSNLYSILLNIPHLSHLHLYQIYNNSIDMETTIPDNRTCVPPLASLEVTDCDFQIIQTVLRLIPNVEKIRIVVWERVRMCNYHTPIMLPILDSLSIRVERSLPYLAQSFRIHAPMLSKLEFECDDVMDDDDDDDDYSDEEPPLWLVGGCGSVMLCLLTELLQEAKCDLTFLKLEMEVNFDSTALESLLRVVPSLEHLDIALVQPGDYEHIPLQAMTPACSNFPKLKSLYFRIPTSDFTFDEVNQLLAFVSRSTDLEVKFLCK